MSIPTGSSGVNGQAVPSGNKSLPQSPPDQDTNNAPRIAETTLQKKRFLLFIKILFKSLEQASELETRDKAKQIIADCTRRNRLGDPAFMPLMDAVDQRLRGHVGETHWRRAHVYMQLYIKRGGDPWASGAVKMRQQQVLSTLIPVQQAEVWDSNGRCGRDDGSIFRFCSCFCFPTSSTFSTWCLLLLLLVPVVSSITHSERTCRGRDRTDSVNIISTNCLVTFTESKSTCVSSTTY